MESPTCRPGNLRSQNKLNIHALFQGGGAPAATTSPTVKDQYPDESAHMIANVQTQLRNQQPMTDPHQHNSAHPGYSVRSLEWGPSVYCPPRSAPLTTSPHSLSPIGSTLPTPSSALSPSLNVNAANFVPGALRRSTPVRINTPNGEVLSFKGQIPPKIRTPVLPKRTSVVVRMETEQQKHQRLASERKASEEAAKAKAEQKEKLLKDEETRHKQEELQEEIKRKAQEERKTRDEAEKRAEEARKAQEEAMGEDELRAKEVTICKVVGAGMWEEEEPEEVDRNAGKVPAPKKKKGTMKQKWKEKKEKQAKEEAEAAARATGAWNNPAGSPISFLNPADDLFHLTIPDRLSLLTTPVRKAIEEEDRKALEEKESQIAERKAKQATARRARKEAARKAKEEQGGKAEPDAAKAFEKKPAIVLRTELSSPPVPAPRTNSAWSKGTPANSKAVGAATGVKTNEGSKKPLNKGKGVEWELAREWEAQMEWEERREREAGGEWGDYFRLEERAGGARGKGKQMVRRG